MKWEIGYFASSALILLTIISLIYYSYAIHTDDWEIIFSFLQYLKYI